MNASFSVAFMHLAPRDYFRFQDLMKLLEGKRVSSKDEIISQISNYFEDSNKSYVSRF